MSTIGLIGNYMWSNFYQKAITLLLLFVVSLSVLFYLFSYSVTLKERNKISQEIQDIRGKIVSLDAMNAKFNMYREYGEDIDRQYNHFVQPINRTAVNKGISDSIQGLGLTMLEEQYAPSRVQNGVTVVDVRLRYRGSYESIRASLANFSRISMLNRVESFELALEKDDVIAIVELKIFSRAGPEDA